MFSQFSDVTRASFCAGCVALTVTFVNAEAPGPGQTKLIVRAEKLFEVIDADGNGKIEAGENLQGEAQLNKAIESLVKDHTIGGSKPVATTPEPVLANPKSMTLAEFSQHFRARAAQRDANLRTTRKIKNLIPIVEQSNPPTMPATGSRNFYYQPRTIITEQVVQGGFQQQPQGQQMQAPNGDQFIDMQTQQRMPVQVQIPGQQVIPQNPIHQQHIFNHIPFQMPQAPIVEQPANVAPHQKEESKHERHHEK